MVELITARNIVFSLLLVIFPYVGDIALGNEPETVLVDIENGNYLDMTGVQLACDLLGIKVRSVFLGRKGDGVRKERYVLDDGDVLIVTARALEHLDENLVARLGIRKGKAKILILGIEPTTDSA